MAAFLARKEEMFGHKTYYREVGYYIIYFREQFERAVQYFDEAYARTPDDLRTLLGRSWARGKACRYKGALDDINRALELEPNNYICNALKALNLYLSLRFEDALILNLRFVPNRKKPDNFVMGVMHCTEAIENCIGRRAGHPLRDHYKIIRRLAWKMAYDAKKPYEPKARFKKKKRKPVVKVQRRKSLTKKINWVNKSDTNILNINLADILEAQRNVDFRAKATADLSLMSETQTAATTAEEDVLEIKDSLHSHVADDFVVPPSRPFPFRPLQRHATNLKRYMAEKYLGVMYLDKFYLENLEGLLGGVGPNRENYDKILNMVKTGYKTLSYKQELLRARRPFYFIKYQEATSSGALKIRQEEELKRMQQIARSEAENMLMKGINYLKVGHTKSVIEITEKLKKYCDTKSKRILPEKDEFLKMTYELSCLAQYSLKRLNPKQSTYDQEKRIHVMFGLPISSEPSTDSVIKQYKSAFVDLRKQIQLYETRVKVATCPEELAWLYYELARFHYEMRMCESSRLYCRKCIQEARNCENWRWVLNSLILLARINVWQRNRNEAKFELTNCIEIAKQNDDKGILNYIYKCLEVVNKLDLESARTQKLLEQREKQILAMLADAEMKDEAAFLFRQMAGLPTSRRLAVMPGVKAGPPPEAPPKDIYQRRASIKPVSKTAILQEKASNKAEGANFLNLIEHHLE